jgi:hypothetical protein
MKTTSRFSQILAKASVIALLLALIAPLPASAAQITSRKLTLSNSAGSASGVTYTFNFTVPSATVIQSAEAVICTTASGACSTPGGFVNSSSTLASQPTNLGDASGWTVNTSTAGKLRLLKSGNVAAPSGSQTVTFGTVTNPTATNTALYARITTYSDTAWTTAIDTGTVAASTATQIQLTGSMDESLVFCTGTSITGQNCGTVAGTTAALGSFSTSAPVSATSVMAASTNGASGYAITVNGAVPTCSGCVGTPSVAAMGTQSTNGSPATSSAGTAQFGMNLRVNTTPSSGADVTGSGSGTYGTNYGTANNFRFFTGDTVATAAAATNANTFTVDYMVNVPGSQAAGAYTATFTYICTATF